MPSGPSTQLRAPPPTPPRPPDRRKSAASRFCSCAATASSSSHRPCGRRQLPQPPRAGGSRARRPHSRRGPRPGVLRGQPTVLTPFWHPQPRFHSCLPAGLLFLCNRCSVAAAAGAGRGRRLGRARNPAQIPEGRTEARASGAVASSARGKKQF
jgi:hypothetical protein